MIRSFFNRRTETPAPPPPPVPEPVQLEELVTEGLAPAPDPVSPAWFEPAPAHGSAAPTPDTPQPPPPADPVEAALATHGQHRPASGEDILTLAQGWLEEGETVALATVTETWGSSPRPPGSQMAVTASGRIAGSVSGGCIEGAVAEVAQEVMAGSPPQWLDFGVSDERAWEVGLACGGKLKVFVEALA